MTPLAFHLWGAAQAAAPRPREAKSKPVKGMCKHCGKVIGRGLHFHEKACAK